MTGPLTGQVALVTGASSGIGEAAAEMLAGVGAAVVVAARRADRLTDLVKRIEAAGGKALAVECDVRDEAAAINAVEQTVKSFGRIDILVNSAGIIQFGGIESAPSEEWRRVIEVNLLGTIYTCKAAVPHMREQGSGDIINISSNAGRKVAPEFSPYSTSKFGLNAMTDALRREVGGYGIRVCTLMPGATTTEVANNISDPTFRQAMQTHVSKEGAMAPSDIADAILFMTMLPRRANVSEIIIRPTIDTTA